MKKKNKICFIFAIIFTVLTLFLAVVCVIGQIGMSDLDEDHPDADPMGVVLFVAALAFGLIVLWVHVFFISFGGVVTSAVNFNCPDKKIRLVSRIMLGLDGVCMAVSFGILLYIIPA